MLPYHCKLNFAWAEVKRKSRVKQRDVVTKSCNGLSPTKGHPPFNDAIFILPQNVASVLHKQNLTTGRGRGLIDEAPLLLSGFLRRNAFQASCMFLPKCFPYRFEKAYGTYTSATTWRQVAASLKPKLKKQKPVSFMCWPNQIWPAFKSLCIQW